MKYGFSIILCLFLCGCGAVKNARVAQNDSSAVAEGTNDVFAVAVPSNAALKELVEYALTNRPSMKQASLQVVDARLQMKQLKADAPLVSDTPWNALDASVSGGYDASSHGTRQLKDLRGETWGSFSSSLSLSLLLWDFGRYDAKVAEQIQNIVSTEMSCVDEGFSIFRDVATSYFGLLESDALYETALTNEAYCVAALEQAQMNLDAGLGTRLDLLKAQMELSAAKETTVAASNDVAVALASLSKSLGIVAADSAAIDGLIRRDGFSYTAGMRQFSGTDGLCGELYDYARTNSPAMRVKRLAVKAAQSNLDWTIRDLYPNLNASLSLNWMDPLWLWRWGVSAGESLFTGFGRTAAIERATVKLQTAVKSAEEAERVLSLNLEKATVERDNAREAFAAACDSVRQAGENLQTVAAKYKLGEASRVDYADAISKYATSCGSRIKAFYRGQLAEIELFVLAGDMPVYRNERVEFAREEKEVKE